jgi:hypothetical protein
METAGWCGDRRPETSSCLGIGEAVGQIVVSEGVNTLSRNEAISIDRDTGELLADLGTMNNCPKKSASEGKRWWRSISEY